MKVCICTFHNGFAPNNIGGVSSAPIYLYEQLKEHFENIEIVALQSHKKHLSPIASVVRYVADPKELANYDFVIFATPGMTYEKYDESTPNKYIDILDNIKKFTIIFNEENDRKLYPYHMNFVTHSNLAFLTFNCPGMADTFEELLNIAGAYDYVSFCPALPSKDVILERARSKKNKIMSTCRWTTSKRIYEYLSMSEDFVNHGIEVYAAGAHQSYWYNLKMGELPTEFYTDLGYFEPSQLPDLLKDVKYHWNFLFQLRGMGLRSHRPRLEIATMEAFREGCLPVVCTEFTPDWLGENSAVRISKDIYTNLPVILGEMSDEERLDRMSNLYDLIQENVVRHYEGYVDRIKSCF